MAQIKVNMTYGASGTLPAVSGANLTTLNASNVSSGTLASARFSGGKVLQILQYVWDVGGSIWVTTSTSFVDTPLTLAITPSASSSKIWINVNLGHFRNESNAANNYITVERDISGGSATDLADGNTFRFMHTYDPQVSPASFSYLDSPSTTSATTYTVQARTDNGDHNAEVSRNNARNSISLWEIGA